jgi:hypothetical protein
VVSVELAAFLLPKLSKPIFKLFKTLEALGKRNEVLCVLLVLSFNNQNPISFNESLKASLGR